MLARYGSLDQQLRWLVPLLRGSIRSAFAMTEPEVASSDATNIRGSIVRSGGQYVINGRWAGVLHLSLRACSCWDLQSKEWQHECIVGIFLQAAAWPASV